MTTTRRLARAHRAGETTRHDNKGCHECLNREIETEQLCVIFFWQMDMHDCHTLQQRQPEEPEAVGPSCSRAIVRTKL